MRVYQMKKDVLAEHLHCDLERGYCGEDVAQKNTRSNSFRRFLCSFAGSQRTRLYYVDFITALAYALSIIFAGLNRSWQLLYLTIAALAVTVVLYLVESFFLYRYKMAYNNRVLHEAQNTVVIRGGERVEIPSRELVVGDLVCLSEGTVLYGDARIVESADLYADEKIVFGATIPQPKISEPLEEKNLPPEKQANMLWRGSYITSGTGLAVVTALNDDCYLEKTGGRKGARQRSFFYNQKNNIGHLATYVYVILVALVLLGAVIFTNHYFESFLIMAVMTSLILLNPGACLMEWIYYRTASKLYKQGVFIKKLEAFDGMQAEKEIYFDASELMQNNLVFSSTLDLRGSEKSNLSYFALCMGEGRFTDILQAPLQRHNLTYEKLSGSFPVFRREEDSAGNVFSIFSNNGKSVAVAAGYWEKMLPLVQKIDDALMERIRELEIHGKLVYLLASDAMNFIPSKLDFSYFSGKMEIESLLVFDIPVRQEVLSMIGQLRHAAVQVYLISNYSAALSEAIAGFYDMDGVLDTPPEKPSYSLPRLKGHHLTVYDDASPIEKEQAMVVLERNTAAQEVIYRIKCMFCGIRRCLNFLLGIGIFLILTVFVLFLNNTPAEKMVFPSLLIQPLLLCPCYYLVESVRNCNQHYRSIVLGIFCGAVGFVGALVGCDMAIFSIELSLVLLSAYFLVSSAHYRKIRRTDVLYLAVALAAAVLPWLFMGGAWLPAVILALFPPIGAFLLDLFY